MDFVLLNDFRRNHLYLELLGEGESTKWDRRSLIEADVREYYHASKFSQLGEKSTEPSPFMHVFMQKNPTPGQDAVGTVSFAVYRCFKARNMQSFLVDLPSDIDNAVVASRHIEARQAKVTYEMEDVHEMMMPGV
jgi:hypothetical protein